MSDWLGWAGTLGSIVLTLAGFYMGWRRFQGESLRSRDVALWADRAIAMLISVELCAGMPVAIASGEREKRLTDAFFTSSTLVEQGRLFFRNVSEERRANGGTYAGLRPKVLDPLVVAHKIAARLLSEPDTDQMALHAVAQKQRRQFVELVQHEIGRRQSASWRPSEKGESPNLDDLLAATGR